MTRICTFLMVLSSSSLFMNAAAFAQATTPVPGSAAPPTTAAAEVTACSQAQMVVDSLLTGANTRLESARQSNNPAEMRAAVDALQTTIRDVRAQLAACAKAGAADPHAGHAMPGQTTQPGAPPMPGVKTTEPGMGQPAAPPAKPPAADPHAGHNTTPAAPAAKPASPTPKSPAPTTKPPATDPHAGHTMSPEKPTRSTEKPTTKPAQATRPEAADPHAGHGGASTQTSSDGKAVDPVCGLRVDPRDAPSTKHGGQTYYFCSIKHRDLFVSHPAKFLPNKQ